MSWILRDGIAVSQDGEWNTTIDLDGDNPTISVRSTTEDPCSIALGIAPTDLDSSGEKHSLTLAEAYVRQGDLIAQFQQKKPWRFGYQIDFRKMETPFKENGICIELWLSVQTALLDSHPQLQVQVKGAKLQTSDQQVYVDQQSRVGMLIHPLDKDDCGVSCDGTTTTMKVFGRFMEKGVIRRMRFRIIATSDESPDWFWKEQFAAFASSPLPLTT